MSIGKKFTAGFVIVIALIIATAAGYSLSSLFFAIANQKFSEAFIQLIVFVILAIIVGVLVTSAWFKQKIR